MSVYPKRQIDSWNAVRKAQGAGFLSLQACELPLDCGELAKGSVQPFIANQFISSGHATHSHLVSMGIYSHFNLLSLNSRSRKREKEKLNQSPYQVHIKAYLSWTLNMRGVNIAIHKMTLSRQFTPHYFICVKAH